MMGKPTATEMTTSKRKEMDSSFDYVLAAEMKPTARKTHKQKKT